MGWTVFSKPPAQGWKAYLDGAYEGSSSRVLRSAIVGGVYYAAVEVTRADKPREVTAVVTLIEGSGYKTMDETMGPYAWGCPAEILALLTPTTNEYALKWRISQATLIPAA